MNDKLFDWLAACSGDPYAFVIGAFPWNQPGAILEKFDGPNKWQTEILCDIRDGLKTPSEAIQEAVASGHGVGKSALVAWIVLWGLSTMVDTRGVVTANTEVQLKTKTWAELGKWYYLFIAKEHFLFTATAIYSRDPDHERTWRIDQVPWSERNAEAFAGLHNQGRRLIIIFDEASKIPDIIWETTEGALTDEDTQIIWCVFGNPTQSIGRFRECFAGGRFASSWRTIQVDSREISFTNKVKIAQWIESYGEDDDFVRIRVKGEFPRKGMFEFFSAAEIDEAMSRDVVTTITDPLAIGVDVARYGANNSVIFFRKGRDARSIPRQVFNGLNTVELASKVFDVHNRYRTDGIMVDGGGVGGGVIDNVRRMHLYCYEVQFGGRDVIYNSVYGNTGEKYANNRAAIYGMLRTWMRTGAIPNDSVLKQQLLSIRYTFNKKDEILLESKEDLEDEAGNPISIDDVDALAITFAYPLQSHAFAGGEHQAKPLVEFEYDPFAPERMVA